MSLRSWLGLPIALALVAALAPAGDAAGGAHPHFNDQGTLTWHTSLADALAAAKAQEKLVFVEFGRLRCTQCRVLCQQVLPAPTIRARLGKIAVGLAADCDDPEPAVEEILRRHLPSAESLPFVGFLRSDGTWVTGFAGARSRDEFILDLAVGERAHAACCAEKRALAAKVPVAAKVVPVRVKSPAQAPVAKDTRKDQARSAAKRGAWGEVVRLCRAAKGADPELVTLEKQAHSWAQERLMFAMSATQRKQFDEALAAAGAVHSAMRGEPEAKEAERGIAAIRIAQEIARLDPKGPVQATVRKNALEEMRGTRWVKLFG